MAKEMPSSFQAVYILMMCVILFIISVFVVYFRQLIKKWFYNHQQKGTVEKPKDVESEM